MGIQRLASYSRGPATLKIGSSYLRSKSSIKFDFGIETFDVVSSEVGTFDKRYKEMVMKASFTPLGTITQELIDIYFGILKKQYGASVFGTADISGSLLPISNKEAFMFKAAAITRPPGLKLTSTETALKECELTFLLANGKDWSDEEARFKFIESIVSPEALPALNPKQIPTISSRVSWSDWVERRPVDGGFDVDFDVKINPETSDEEGIYDYSVGDIGATAKGELVGISMTDVLAKIKLQGTGVSRGMSAVNVTDTMVIKAVRAGGLNVELPNMRLMPPTATYGREEGDRRFADGFTFEQLRLSASDAVANISIVEEAKTGK